MNSHDTPSSDPVRIVMIGPHGEMDYVEKILDMGVPCCCGSDQSYAGIWPEHQAISIVSMIRQLWLSPHIDVQIESTQPSIH